MAIFQYGAIKREKGKPIMQTNTGNGNGLTLGQAYFAIKGRPKMPPAQRRICLQDAPVPTQQERNAK